MTFIDTHFHLDLSDNDKNAADRIEKERIYTLAVTNAPRVFKHSQELCRGKKYIKPALGYHPEIIPVIGDELKLFEKFFPETRYIGEIGLDYSNSSIEEKNEQVRIFRHIIDLCETSGDKVLSIHSRKAENDVVDIIGKDFKGKVILHYYSGGVTPLKKAIEYGFYFSVNYAMTKSANGRTIISKIPIKRILTESDGPFVSIVNQKANPTNINLLVDELSKIFNMSSKQMAIKILDNFRKLLIEKD